MFARLASRVQSQCVKTLTAVAIAVGPLSYVAILGPSLAFAQSPGPARESLVNITLRSFSLSPNLLRLKAGEPTLLLLENDSSIAHDFTAPEFFASVEARSTGASAMKGGTVSLKPHARAAITVTPRAGRYPVKCSHAFHKALGMHGVIVVE